MRVHFIAIGGAGMSVIAELMLAQGHEVSGSDRADSARLRRLAELGAQVHVGHDAAHVLGADLVVVSSAIKAENTELQEAEHRGIEVIHRSVALARVAAGRKFIAVAGAHGKTTTSAMLALALSDIGADPGYAIGANLRGRGSGAHLGAGEAFVAEADESDGSFLAYEPTVAVVTNVEPDHLDHYGSAEALKAAFVDFAGRIVPDGLLVACLDDPGAKELAEQARGRGIRVRGYGFGPAPSADFEYLRVDATEEAGGQSTVTLSPSATTGGEAVSWHTEVPGRHNVLNAAAAYCAGLELAAEPQALASALASFSGTARRFETRGTEMGVRVIDDYAHHPTEVAAVIATARAVAAAGRVIVLFQPHLFSRTKQFAAEFATALAGADEVVLTSIYPAREEPMPGVTSELITEQLAGAVYRANHDQAAEQAAELARPGDVILTVGAGDVTELGPRILASLAQRGKTGR